jgi:hypothetical protein
LPWLQTKKKKKLLPWLMVGFGILTYHASNTMRAEETLTTSCTVCSSIRNVLWISEVNLLTSANSTSPSWLTSRNPWTQITVLVRFQIVCFLCAFFKETVEVEFYFCCCAYTCCYISWCTTWEMSERFTTERKWINKLRGVAKCFDNIN